MKTCIDCGAGKPLSEFYKNARMKDGHLNSCKACRRAYQRERDAEKRTDPEWTEAERARGREKYHRLGYRAKHKQPSAKRREAIRRYRQRFPEKRAARRAAQGVEAPAGAHRHHWSYRPSDQIDVILLTSDDHARLHRSLDYDPAAKLYRTPAGDLLDSKDAHLRFAASIGVKPVA